MRLPEFSAADATRRFNADLYREHLEEASFLYEQRRGLYDDPEVSWLTIEEYERRLETHLCALVSGEGPAVEISRRQAEEGEAGALYAAVCVCCRTNRRDLLGVLLNSLDLADALKSQAVSDAIKDEMPPEWAQALAANLSRGYEKLIPMLAHYSGYRRVPADQTLIALLDRVPASGLPDVIWGLGRVGGDGVASHLVDYVRHEDAAVRRNAVLALLRRGDDRVLAACRQGVVNGDHAMCLPLAVGGRRSDAAVLRGDPLTKGMTPELMIAWAVLGELSAVRFLVERLTDDTLAAAAATVMDTNFVFTMHSHCQPQVTNATRTAVSCDCSPNYVAFH